MGGGRRRKGEGEGRGEGGKGAGKRDRLEGGRYGGRGKGLPSDSRWPRNHCAYTKEDGERGSSHSFSPPSHHQIPTDIIVGLAAHVCIPHTCSESRLAPANTPANTTAETETRRAEPILDRPRARFLKRLRGFLLE